MNNKLFSLVFSFLIAVCFLPLQTAAAAAAAPELDSHVRNGSIPPGLARQLDEHGVADVLVALIDDDVQQGADRMRRERNLKANDRHIRALLAGQFAGRKQEVLATLADRDYSVLSEYENLPVMHLALNRRGLLQLLRSGQVRSVSENQLAYPHLVQSLPLVKADLVQGLGHTGANTAVAVLDTGIDYTRTAFGSCTAPGVPATCRVAYMQDFAPNDGQPDADSAKHGTNVAGIVAGMAPGAKIIGLDVFTGSTAYYDDISAAIDWVIGNRDAYNIVATNLSLGDGSYTAVCPTDLLAIGIANLKTNGVASAVSSGNDGYKTSISAPACAPDALSVGAVYDADLGGISYSLCTDSVTAADKITCFSNGADILKILAPGGQIDAAGITMFGTSQAAPHAAGAVALLKEAVPTMGVAEVIAELTASGDPVTDTRTGAGNRVTPRLNIYDTITGLLYAPLADFTATPLAGGAPMIVDFTDATAHVPTAWAWSFGDSGTSTLQNPTHVYAGSGAYTVTMTATNAFGADALSQPGYISVSGCGSLPVRTGGFGFSSLQGAYDLAATGAAIESHLATFAENLVLDRDIAITLAGGFNCEFDKTAPATTIAGSLTISAGTVTADNLVIQ